MLKKQLLKRVILIMDKNLFLELLKERRQELLNIIKNPQVIKDFSDYRFQLGKLLGLEECITIFHDVQKIEEKL